ncbi:MAG TPA: M13-type metalloendopeptidase [Rhodanobacteraceae bacterium]|jgi:predicted metalloendopeptidase|nr:M13-type metalloendopeptidase [Rhodanobacteraceae bacterium]
MKRTALALACAALIAACSSPQDTQNQAAAPTGKPAAPAVPAAPAAPAPAAAPAAAAALVSGIDLKAIDATVAPGADFYQHVNGKWLDTVEIPADKGKYGTGTIVFDKIQEDLHSLVDDAAAGKSADPKVDTRKIGDLYAGFMDEATLDAQDLKPLQERFARIDALKDSKGLPALFDELQRNAANVTAFGLAPNAPVVVAIHQDNKDATKYVADLRQSGLGLPDRDYYLKDDDAKLKGMRDQYVKHIEKMLSMAGDKDAAKTAASILKLETALAKAQWDNVTLRDPIKAYNKVEIAKLSTLAPGFDWDAYLTSAGVKGKVDSVIVGQPSYQTAMAKLVASTPIATWKAYLRWHTLSETAPLLSKRFADENFAFYGTVLTGVTEDQPRWKRGLALVNASIGEELGKLYTAKYFPPQAKARAKELVANLLEAFKQGIDQLDWMSPQTKQAAHEKLAKFTPKIGYPDTWRDYSALKIEKGDLLGNVMRSAQFDYQRNINKLGQPIDRGEWGLTPQTLNAYYNPELNEIVFPAAILQPPYFNAAADDAVNYGSIGAVIGHEISHGFDDQGSQYDGDGNLRDWWTKEDHEKFAAKTKALVDEYSAFEPVPGYHINGALTLGENIADNSGLAVAYKAYQIALRGEPAPVIDGLTGPQRFYTGFATVWRAKYRENAAIQQIKADPHSISKYRAIGTVANQPGFFQAFDIKEGDKMFVAPDKRVIIW